VQLKPRYGSEPVVRIETDLGDVWAPARRQHGRFIELLRGLDDEQWRAPSRCDQWTVQDVVAHLADVNQFWALSITSGLAGQPTKFLDGFDPAATPEQLVAAKRSSSPAETFEQFMAATDELAAALARIGATDGGWDLPAEAPPGHIALRALVLHGLWDAWVHERDVALPLGLSAVEEPDEIVASLHYAAALGPAFLATNGSTRTGVLRFAVTEPAASFVVAVGPSVVVRDETAADAGAPTVTGPAVDVLEALSCRTTVDLGLAPADRWLLGSLAEVFDLVP
jgi:uncharacterized protein (TIGR03083 family)